MTDLEWSPVVVRLGDLSHWSDNPVTLSKAQAKKLLKSTEKLGRMQTLAIGPQNGDGKHPLYDGHQRVNVWGAAFGMELQVNALQSSRPLTDEERHQVPIMLRTAAGSLDWDALAGWDANSLMEWGFDSDMLDGWKRDIAALGNLIESETPEPQDAEPQIDRAEELQEKWQVKTGDLWRIGEHRLLCGDSTKREDVERVTQLERASHCVTSPPYFVGKEYERQFTEVDILTFISDVADLITSFVQENRRIVVNCATTAWSHIGGNVDYRINLDWWQVAFRNLGWLTRSIRIWSKHGGLVHNAPSADIVDMHWEYLATFYKPDAKPYRGQNRVGEGWSTSGIWEGIHGEEQKEHSAPYPVVIPGRFIELYTDNGENVLEPFCGSGTTIVACQNLSRKCRAIEISPAYCAVTLERMSTAFPALTIERIT